jgi:tRNA U34 5-methylaminomethyl-2-thiouridine-forming methyltransferase MnmC
MPLSDSELARRIRKNSLKVDKRYQAQTFNRWPYRKYLPEEDSLILRKPFKWVKIALMLRRSYYSVKSHHRNLKRLNLESVKYKPLRLTDIQLVKNVREAIKKWLLIHPNYQKEYLKKYRDRK